MDMVKPDTRNTPQLPLVRSSGACGVLEREIETKVHTLSMNQSTFMNTRKRVEDFLGTLPPLEHSVGADWLV